MTLPAAGTAATAPCRPLTYDAEDLARIFRRRVSDIVRVTHSWEKHRGFPPRLPGRKTLWSASLVDRWIATPDAQKPLRGAPAGKADDLPGDLPAPRIERAIALQRNALEARYG